MDKRTITIAGHEFEVSTPYAEGHTCTEAEAKALNQTRCENVRNNMARVIKGLVDDEGNLDKKAMASAVEAVTEYDKDYEFTIGNVGGRTALDPVEKEAMKIAREGINALLQSNGKKLADYRGQDAKPELAQKYEEAIATQAETDQIRELAKRRIEERKAAADAAASSLDLG